LPHGDYFYAVFRSLWQELGGTLQGKLRTGAVPANQVAFSTHISPQLSEVIRDINKFSNNTMARHLFLTLGTTMPESDKTNALLAPVAQNQSAIPRSESPLSDISKSGNQLFDQPGIASARLDGVTPSVEGQPPRCEPSATIARSTAAIQQWLVTQKLQFPELVLENGSGLSRAERISPQSLVELLQHATRSPFSAELVASLPILGMDGTMKKRFKGNEIAGYAHLKSGMLEGVKSMAGYVQAQSGEQWIVVFIINHPNAKHGQEAQDALVEWLQKQH